MKIGFLVLLSVLFVTVSATAQQCETKFSGYYMDFFNPVLKGARTTIDIVKINSPGQNLSKGVWISMTFSHLGWLQFGYKNPPSGKNPIFFKMYFPFGNPPAQWTTLNPVPEMEVGAQRTLELRYLSGTSWELAIDSIPTFLGDFGATDTLRQASVYLEQGEQHCPLTSFPLIRAFPALEFYDGANWNPPPAVVRGLSPWWGVEGQLQNPTLQPNEVRMGSRIPLLNPDGQALW